MSRRRWISFLTGDDTDVLLNSKQDAIYENAMMKKILSLSSTTGMETIN